MLSQCFVSTVLFLWVLHKTPSLLIREIVWMLEQWDDNKLGLSWPDRFSRGSRNRGFLSINTMGMKLVELSLFIFLVLKVLFLTNHLFNYHKYSDNYPGADPVPSTFWDKLVSVGVSSIGVGWGHMLMRYYDCSSNGRVRKKWHFNGIKMPPLCWVYEILVGTKS